MMADIYKKVKLVDGESDPEFLAKVIYGGHYWAPRWKMQGVFHDHVDSPKDVTHVVNVLDMWSFLEEAYEKFSAKQREQIAEEVGPLGKSVTFYGFDGNDESSQMGIARFLIDDMERFSRFKGRELNSRLPTLARYRRMVELFEPMRANLVGNRLSVQRVVTLMKAWSST